MPDLESRSCSSDTEHFTSSKFLKNVGTDKKDYANMTRILRYLFLATAAGEKPEVNAASFTSGF